ncbi:MAG TPA: universal stress protein [Gemmatimonadaceae bacterium]|nr:universal stress protein [Gemmatimonadaceae bacterium]
MSTEATLTPAKALSPIASFRHLFVPNTSYKLLLAIDNDDNAAAAIRLTAALAHRGADPTVLRTLELMSPAVGATAADTTFAYAQAALGEDFYFDQERIIRDNLRTVLGRQPMWPVRTVVGDAPATIVYEAEESGSDLLVMGIHHHGTLAQALGENTATRVMSKASMPIIGVRPDRGQLPRRIMVATDFGNASWEAAHVAANLVDPGGVVILVHVALPSPLVDEGDEGAALVQREGIEHAFEKLANEIKEGKSIRVETITREGDAATELLSAAEQANPDMIATASQRHRLLTRIMLGSVSRKLVRDGNWSMLITPPVRGGQFAEVR